MASSLGLTWLGVDGSRWDLQRGPVQLDGPPEGLGHPKWTRPTVSSPALDGQRLSSVLRSMAQPREGFLPAYLVQVRDVATWLATVRAWWASWSPDVAGTLQVTAPDGSVRSLACFLEDDSGYAPEADPTLALSESLAVTWVADDPWWKGPVATTALGLPSGGDFLAGGAAPPFVISPSNSVGAGTLANPGEVDAWPVITVAGPASSFSVTIAGKTVAGVINVTAGASLVIDTNPTAQSALLIGADGTVTNVTAQLSSVGFTPVPAGGNAAATTALTGGVGASLTVAVTPRYRRAW